MKHLKFIRYIPLVIAIFAVYGLITHLHPQIATQSHTEAAPVVSKPDVATLFKLTNEERQKSGLQPLVLDERLNESATAKCNQMVSEHQWGHVNKEGVHGWQMIKDYEPVYKQASENLADGYTTPQAVMDAWNASPPHKAAILNPDYTNVGFDSCMDGTKVYTVEHFTQL